MVGIGLRVIFLCILLLKHQIYMIHGPRHFEFSCGMRCSGTTEIKATNAKAIRKGS